MKDYEGKIYRSLLILVIDIVNLVVIICLFKSIVFRFSRTFYIMPADI